MRFSVVASTKERQHTKSDKEEAAEILKKRDLAAKHLKERKDGRPIDPMEDIGALGGDTDLEGPENIDEKEREIGSSAVPASLIKPR